MAEFKIKSFVVGKEKFPIWFNDEAVKGRARVNKDDDGDIVNVIVYGIARQMEAVPGDTIMLLKTGLTVVKQEQAKKYNIQKESVKNEDE